MLPSGKIIGYEVADTVYGEKITYKPIPGSEGADVVFVSGDKLPALVNDQAITPEGKVVFFKYFDRAKNEWVDNANVQVLDAEGNPLTWNGKEWVAPLIGWQAYEKPVDLSPGSELVQKLDKIGLPTSYSIATDYSNKPDVNGKYATINQQGYLNDVQVVPFKIGAVEGEVLELFVILKNNDGSYTQEPITVAVNSNQGNVGFGTPFISGDQYDQKFRNPNGSIKFTITFAEMLEYFKSEIGDKMNFSVPVWDNKGGKNPLTDPGHFALTVFPNFAEEFNIQPGESPVDMYNGWYRFAKLICEQKELCYAANTSLSPDLYSNPKLMREWATTSPFGLLADDVTTK